MKNLTYSLTDQLAVSGGNFLTVAACAHLLSPSEQGHFLFVYSAYIAVLTLNIALFFSAAVSVMANSETPKKYAKFLAQNGAKFWVLAMAVVVAVFCGFGENLNWVPSIYEGLTFAVFLLFQQGADFGRRLGYLQEDIKSVSRNSCILYCARLVLLFLGQPGTLSEILGILSICAFPFAFLAWKGNALQLESRPCVDGRRHWELSKWALAITPVAWWFSYAPLFFIGATVSAEVAAIFGNIRNLTGAANVVMELLETAVPILLAKKFATNSLSAVKKTTLSILGIGLLVWVMGLVGILLMGAWVLGIAFGATYTPYTNLLLLAWVGVLAYFLNRLLQVYFKSQGVMKIEFLGTVFAAIAMTIYLFANKTIEPAAVLYVYIAIPLSALITQIIYAYVLKVK